MPFTVQQLIQGHQEPVTVSLQDKAQKALELMIENDFSQLPVIDENEKPLGIVTSDSILRALNNFGVSLPELQVSHAIVKVDRYSPDEDLFDLLDDLKNSYTVLIVNNDGTLNGIVTSYDTTEYFRRRAEDLMYVEDIETTLKDFIRLAFANGTEEPDQKMLSTTVLEITDTDLRKKFQNALNHYLNLHFNGNASINQNFATDVFTRHFTSNEQAKSFDDLTLNEYIQLMLHKSMWASLSPIFSLKPEAIRNLLNGIRLTRNDLAHFHGEISSNQRDQLHFCAEWLERHRSKVAEVFSSKSVLEAVDIAVATTESSLSGSLLITTEANFVNELAISDASSMESVPAEIIPLAELLGPDDSRYALLALRLQRIDPSTEKIRLTFKQIEEIIDNELPSSARKHRIWWSNNLEINPQARQWWDAGWRVSTVNINEETVVFARIAERKKLYVDFFSSLLAQLDSSNPFPMRSLSPDGESWATIASLPADNLKVASLGFSFARRKRFRVELYIDTGNELKNKEIFNKLLSHKDQVESELGTSVSWERLDGVRASRIALYHEGSITDTGEELTSLRDWAVDAMIKFQKVMDKHLSEVL